MFNLPEQGIRLRGFQGDKDLDQIISMHNDREVASLMSITYIVPQGAKLREDYKKSIEDSAEIFCIIETIPGPSKEEEAEFIGFVALYGPPDARLRRESAYSLALVKKFWNKGYGKAVTKFIVEYAFESLFMHRIWLGAIEGNDRAIAVYKKCGFVVEGRERKAVRGDGEWKDIIKMGMIIDDWIAMKKNVPGGPSEAKTM